MPKQVRTRSTNPTIRRAAQMGVRLYKVGSGLYTHSAMAMAKQAGCSVPTVRRAAREVQAEGKVAGVLSLTRFTKVGE